MSAKSDPKLDHDYYVTTAIVYPNARIHVGWAWECLGADWLVRAQRAFGRQVYFATGMDEHSVNVQKAAETQGLTPKVYCDQMAQDIEKVLRQMGLSHDRFIRTSDADHVRVVQALVQRAFDNGDIYQAKYEGHYCESCEAFYTDKDLVNGLCPAHQKAPKWISEENYFFKLSKYQGRLLELYKSNPEWIQPAHRRSEIVNFVEGGLQDFSISRSNFTWGIPLPFDPKHVVYVWFDALINYVTAAGFDPAKSSSEQSAAFKKRWPASVHIVGKDISRFHTIYWPAMLMSVDLPLPEKVFVHGFLTFKGERMSKSSGNRVSPDEVMAVTGPDPFRYYLLAENQFSQDGGFAWESLVLKCNADLSNDMGNLVNRSISMTRKYFPEARVAAPAAETHSKAVRESFESLRKDLQDAIDKLDPSAYAQACTARSRVLNLYIDQTKPWALAKKIDEPAFKAELGEVMYTLLEGIRWIATALRPVLPFGMPEVFRQLGMEVPAEAGSLAALEWGKTSFQPGEPKPVYPRIELPPEA